MCGMPQGIRIGLVVFLAMVNRVATSAPRRWKYVEDVTADESCVITDQGETKPQEAMFSICKDASQDHTSLNASKCTTMQLHIGQSAVRHLILTQHLMDSWCL